MKGKVFIVGAGPGDPKLITLKGLEYYLGVSSLFYGLAAGTNSNFEGRDEHIRHIGKLARIFTDSGQIFITSVYHLDDDEAQKLKLLNQPNEILIINVEESPFNSFVPDANIDMDRAVEAIYNILLKQDIILEYYI